MMQRDNKGRFVKKTDVPATLQAFKAFDMNMQCRGYQFEVGKTYTHNGRVKVCEGGFHSCENPLDILNYYDLCDSRFAVVSVAGEISRHNDDSKIASAQITINAELKLPEFIKSTITWMMDICKGLTPASGNSSKLAASGNYSQLAASGNYSQLAASGDSSKLAASGNSSKLAASGNSSKLAASGDSSVVASTGLNCIAKAGVNGAIMLTRWVEAEKRYRVSVGYVGENIKADTWYSIDKTGKFIEVTT